MTKTEHGAPLPVFDGTLESLRTLAKAARTPSRAGRQLLAAAILEKIEKQ